MLFYWGLIKGGFLNSLIEHDIVGSIGRKLIIEDIIKKYIWINFGTLIRQKCMEYLVPIQAR